MNDHTLTLLNDIVERLERDITARNCPATVILDGHPRLMLSDYDYLRDEATAKAFEHRAAAKAKETNATRWAFAVPMVWLVDSNGISARAVSNHPLRQGEQEVIMWMTLDLTDGVDYGRVPYTRRPDKTPVFDDPEIAVLSLQPTDDLPGRELLKSFLNLEG